MGARICREWADKIDSLCVNNFLSIGRMVRMWLQEPDLLKKMMKKLKKEYGNASKLAVGQREKMASHEVICLVQQKVILWLNH